MKTDAKTMAEIWREIENNPDAEIEYFSTCAKWYTKSDFVFDPYSTWYRIKPTMQKLACGVEVPANTLPKPKKDCSKIWILSTNKNIKVDWVYADYVENYVMYYSTKEEALEAYRILFGD